MMKDTERKIKTQLIKVTYIFMFVCVCDNNTGYTCLIIVV